MAEYIAQRLLQLVLVLIGVSMVVFVTMHLLPGDVAQLLLGDHATARGAGPAARSSSASTSRSGCNTCAS